MNITTKWPNSFDVADQRPDVALDTSARHVTSSCHR